MSDVTIAIELQTPKPVNYVRTKGLGKGDEVPRLVDVADLSDETLDAMAEAVKQAFLDNARKRRSQTND